jgi:hypothetical protein
VPVCESCDIIFNWARTAFFHIIQLFGAVDSLFNDVLSSSDYIMSNERMKVNNELERIWTEVVVA